MFKQYQKRPTVVKAIRFDGTKEMADYINQETGKIDHVIEVGKPDGDIEYRAVIKTYEGDMTACPGDYIIIGIEGEIYPCKSNIFEKIYQEVIDERCKS